MTTWLPRSLVTMAVGAVLAFAVTVSWRAFDVQTAGTALLAVGSFDLLLNAGLVVWSRTPGRPAPRPRAAVVEYHHADDPAGDPTYEPGGGTPRDGRTRYDLTDQSTQPLPRSLPGRPER